MLTKAVQEIRRNIGNGRILNIYGFRAEESPARRKKAQLARNNRFSRRDVEIFDWLPIHAWAEKEVWADIHASGVPSHKAYNLGMPRLSCSFCIFAPRDALILAGRARPELLREYVELEREIGHSFRHRQSLAEIQQAVSQGETPKQITGDWNM